MKFKFIIVVVSCSNMSEDNICFNSLGRYNFFKKCNKLYYDMFKDEIKFFYVEYKNDIIEDLIEDGDFIYIKGTEEPLIPNFLNKTKLCIEYIDKNYDYDYVLRTNLSSLWNMSVLNSLYDNIPRNNFFGGHVMFDSFISGTGIIISRDLVNKFLEINKNQYYYWFNEDVAISMHMKERNVPLYNIGSLNNYKMNFQTLEESLDENSTQNNILEINDDTYTDDILYFRVKNARVERDIYVFKKILKKLYNIDPEKI